MMNLLRAPIAIMRHPLFSQLARFGIVGITATAVNYGLVIGIVETTSLHPLNANVIAILISIFVSYCGHQYWTFKGNPASIRSSMRKFFIVAAGGFALNESLFYILLTHFHLYYPIALLIVLLIIPPITFVTSKFWTFR